MDLNSHMTRIPRAVEDEEAEARARLAEERAKKLLARTRAVTTGSKEPPSPRGGGGADSGVDGKGGATRSGSGGGRDVSPRTLPQSGTSPRGASAATTPSAGDARSIRAQSLKAPPTRTVSSLEEGSAPISPRRAGGVSSQPPPQSRSVQAKPVRPSPPPVHVKSSTKKHIPEKLVVKMLTELSIRTRQWEGEDVHLSFTGVSMTSWLQQTLKCQSREDALHWARAMQENGVFYGVDPENEPLEDMARPYIINLAHEVVSVEWPRICSEDTSAAPPPPTNPAPRPPPMLRRPLKSK